MTKEEFKIINNSELLKDLKSLVNLLQYDCDSKKEYIKVLKNTIDTQDKLIDSLKIKLYGA